MGRRGVDGNPGTILGIMTVSCTFLLLTTVRPILLSVRRQYLLKTMCWLTFGSTLFYLTVYGGGFPYSGDPKDPAPKRLSIYHTSRSFTRNGETNSDSGVVIGRWDHHW